MNFYTGSDHGGIEMREQLAAVLRDWGHDVIETFGPADASESADYPDVAVQVSQAVLASNQNNQPAFGLLVCGTGQGMAISANKIPGIRAGAVSDPFSATMIREHNDANVICRIGLHGEFCTGLNRGRQDQINFGNRVARNHRDYGREFGPFHKAQVEFGRNVVGLG